MEASAPVLGRGCPGPAPHFLGLALFVGESAHPVHHSEQSSRIGASLGRQQGWGTLWAPSLWPYRMGLCVLWGGARAGQQLGDVCADSRVGVSCKLPIVALVQ